MNQWLFLEPKNREYSFQIEPLALDLFWNKLWTKEFYFTPLGIFASQLLLYIIYLLLFTAISIQQFRIYDDYNIEEYIFWVMNIMFYWNYNS